MWVNGVLGRRVLHRRGTAGPYTRHMAFALTHPLVIPDLHGRLDLLELTLAQYPQAHYLSLGDAFDRGPQGLKVVKKLLDLHDQGRATLLMGNHERMASEGLRWYRQYQQTANLTDYRKAMEGFRWWMQAGGETVRQEAQRHGQVLTLETFPEDLERYLGLLRRIVYVTADGAVHDTLPDQPSVMVVHATPPKAHPDYATPEAAALWLRPYDGPFTLPAGVTFSVHGHTPVRVPTRLDDQVYIDTGAYKTGVLAVLPLQTIERPSGLRLLQGEGNPAESRKLASFGEPIHLET